MFGTDITTSFTRNIPDIVLTVLLRNIIYNDKTMKTITIVTSAVVIIMTATQRIISVFMIKVLVRITAAVVIIVIIITITMLLLMMMVVMRMEVVMMIMMPLMWILHTHACDLSGARHVRWWGYTLRPVP